MFLEKLKKKKIYSDIQKDLDIHPLTKDIALLYDETAVKESLKNLILTDRGERLFQPNLGSDVRKTLFDLNTEATLKLLKEKIKDVINNYERRINLIDVEVLSIYDDNKIKVNIYFYMKNSENQLSTTIFLERVR